MAPEVKRWITVKGVHIPVFDGESVEDAIKHRFKKEPSNKINEPEGKAPTPEFKSEKEAYDYYRKKFSECSSTYRNKVAHNLNIEGRGSDKIDALAKAMVEKWKRATSFDKEQAEKEKQIATNKQQAQEVIQASKPEPFTDPLKGALGNRQKVEKVAEKLKYLQENKIINPHFRDRPQPKGNNYHNNCALCTASTIMQAMGYDVEAGLQPKGNHYGIESIMKPDISNPDNYLLSSNLRGQGRYAEQYSFERAIEKEVKAKYDATHGGEVAYPVSASIGSPEWRAYREYRDGLHAEIDKVIKERSVPKGAPAVARAVCNKVKNWGDGAFGEIAVHWAGTSSSHSMFIYNDGGTPVVYCSQTGDIDRGEDAIKALLSETKANHTLLVRYDNAKFKVDDNGTVTEGLKRVMDQMFVKRGGTT
jgi:hypothetical protein